MWLTVLKRLKVIPRAFASLMGSREPFTVDRGVALSREAAVLDTDNGGGAGVCSTESAAVEGTALMHRGVAATDFGELE